MANSENSLLVEKYRPTKLEGFFSDLQWSLDLNPYTNALNSFEI